LAALELIMPTQKDRAERRDRQSAEIEENQAELRKSIAETDRLVTETEVIIRRHRKEWEDSNSQPDLTKKPSQGAED
jgi:uncharacterized protein YydD (DUF2326 family)